MLIGVCVELDTQIKGVGRVESWFIYRKWRGGPVCLGSGSMVAILIMKFNSPSNIVNGRTKLEQRSPRGGRGVNPIKLSYIFYLFLGNIFCPSTWIDRTMTTSYHIIGYYKSRREKYIFLSNSLQHSETHLRRYDI